MCEPVNSKPYGEPYSSHYWVYTDLKLVFIVVFVHRMKQSCMSSIHLSAIHWYIKGLGLRGQLDSTERSVTLCHTILNRWVCVCVYFESVWGAHHGGGEINISWRCHLCSGQHREIGVCPSHTAEDHVNNLESNCQSSCPPWMEQERSVCVCGCRCRC